MKRAAAIALVLSSSSAAAERDRCRAALEQVGKLYPSTLPLALFGYFDSPLSVEFRSSPMPADQQAASLVVNGWYRSTYLQQPMGELVGGLPLRPVTVSRRGRVELRMRWAQTLGVESSSTVLDPELDERGHGLSLRAVNDPQLQRDRDAKLAEVEAMLEPCTQVKEKP